ncbi:CTP synthase 1 isoform X1 [Gasterosteus aculeatus]|uniref:CTP synthase n=2 Tax=Gasterosteus aculeatus aculeatus TaxID=481459 RepID=A0AAQ4PRL5_GASAC|nr:CTP synthase 1b isoform X1 [Gasterosteus aculeatus aculeatus]XP_040020483.1 CTP synthase 1b isoform X1 [Gasterosteus aculeatus aculeatus]XP_040020484.1 CTP synthase 1b isoform X1 [Gasterosteus aculeatus aculeatus]XP_040020485.1 CTP synthase 1b isoform X1 [Gasterosteus aculeatus aculeatus]
MKYILVTGGVISGIGKGIIASSVGTILKSCGLRVTAIKIDPYINIDAGTFSPYEHGEVFVLDDGGEVDLDLGNYERFLDIRLTRDNNLTTGKIYQSVINKERRGDYLGKTVQVVPHITDAIQEWVMKQARISVDDDGVEPQVCVIELGGTVGDIESMPFIEAFRQFQFKVKRENFCNIHVSLVPQPKATGEQKTKPTQNSVRELRGLGLSPDLIMCRCSSPLETSAKEKISMFCHVEPTQVICVHDVSSVYRVPLLLEDQGVVSYLCERLSLPVEVKPRKMLTKWKEMADRSARLLEHVSIALVGKYTKLSDSYTSVVKALEHSALAVNHKLEIKYIDSADLETSTLQGDPVKYHEAWQKLCSSHGVLVPGGFGVRGTEGKMHAIHWARKQNKPFLGVCLGMQLAVCEFARDVLGWEDANSTEFNPESTHPVVIDMPEHNPGQMGGTMRLGKRRTIFKSSTSVLRKLYGGVEFVDERHRHRFEVNPELKHHFEKRGLHFVGEDVEGERMEIIELDDHCYFVGVQYHPEFTSRPIKPSPPYFGLLLAAAGKLPGYLAKGCRLSPRDTYSGSSGSSSPEADLSELKFPSLSRD